MALFQHSVLNTYLSGIDVLQSWHELTIKQFLKELKKVEFNLDKEAEWMKYFNRQKAKANVLKTLITLTDEEIDTMVYELYGLTVEEIGFVEGGLVIQNFNTIMSTQVKRFEG